MRKSNPLDDLQAALAEMDKTRFTPPHQAALVKALHAATRVFGCQIETPKFYANGQVVVRDLYAD